MIPLVNATVTRIAGGGSSEDYDAPAGTDTQRWSGAADAYVTEQVLQQVGGDSRQASAQRLSLDEVKVMRMVVPRDVGKLVQRNDVVTFDYADQTGLTRTVRDVQTYVLFGTVRLHFTDA